jgi:hypothetical protein
MIWYSTRQKEELVKVLVEELKKEAKDADRYKIERYVYKVINSLLREKSLKEYQINLSWKDRIKEYIYKEKDIQTREFGRKVWEKYPKKQL